jgi:tetratricopeptide (TPR) repeat protein
MCGLEWRRYGRLASRLGLVLAACLALPLGAGRAHAQMKLPDEFKNLQVLPKDIPKPELVNIMKGFTAALGVRCENCHVEKPGEDQFDFAADDKAEKKTARVMMKMVQDINQKWLTQVVRDEHEEAHGSAKEHEKSKDPGKEHDTGHDSAEEHEKAKDPGKAEEHEHEAPLQVRCVTCHHGMSRPRTIDEVVGEAMAKDGVQAGIQKYRDLRKQYYGGFQFDFTDRPLNRMVQDLLKDKKTADALALLELDAEMNPESGMVRFLFGEAYLAQGDKAKAIESYKKALELQPKLRMASEKLEELQKGSGAGG